MGLRVFQQRGGLIVGHFRIMEEQTVGAEFLNQTVRIPDPVVPVTGIDLDPDGFSGPQGGERDSYTADDSEYASEVVFLTDGAVRDFRLLGLTLEEITDDGELVFSFEELYVYGELTPEKGLAVRMNIPETIPYYGISYMDGTGAVRVFSVNYSGFDGSVQLAEIGG